MEPETARLTYRLAVAFAFVAAAAVPLAYQSYSDGEWKRHAYGRHLMASDALLAVMLGSFFVVAVIPAPLWVKWLILTGEMLIFGVLRIQRVRFMRRSTQSTGYDNKPDDGPEQRERESSGSVG